MDAQILDDQINVNEMPVPENNAEPWTDDKISHEFRESLKKDLLRKKKKKETKQGQSRHAKYDVQLDRHEAKYIIPNSMVPAIRDFIAPFCESDPHGKGNPPQYRITTLQLDSPDLALHHAKENDSSNRFKLRVRTYDEPGSSPVYMEVKQKRMGIIIKTRTSIPPESWSEDLIYNPRINLSFKSKKEEIGFLTFRRLVYEIGARPVILIRYMRESYFGKMDHYARVTIDRKLEYLPTNSWTSWGKGQRWISMDCSLAQNKAYPFSGVVLEIKTLSDAPQWIIDLVMHFSLERTGNCKYSNAVWLESMFRGSPALPAYADCLLSY